MPPSLRRLARRLQRPCVLRRAQHVAKLGVLALLLAIGAGRSGAAGETPHPRRIVSMNACADQYLIALADKDQIAALTRFARDPNLSFYAEQAKAYPVSGDEPEAVLALKPDLVITNPYHAAGALAPLTGRARVLELNSAESFDEVVANTRIVAAAIGQTARGEALVRAMQARVRAAGRRPLGGVAAYYQRGGYVAGPGSIMDDLMARAGLANLARRLNSGALGQLSLEQIVRRHPDFLILTDERHPGQDEGDLMLDHPALARAEPPQRRLHVPQALTVCGGPSYPAALERLQAEANRARGAARRGR
ncbi:MAG: ABC transporter substrate-binding protein [Caulobacteraceae bacterium]|nr:ABC transporter substrate-binding protein [Caulobacteraceae bacterium]